MTKIKVSEIQKSYILGNEMCGHLLFPFIWVQTNKMVCTFFLQQILINGTILMVII